MYKALAGPTTNSKAGEKIIIICRASSLSYVCTPIFHTISNIMKMVMPIDIIGRLKLEVALPELETVAVVRLKFYSCCFY